MPGQCRQPDPADGVSGGGGPGAAKACRPGCARPGRGWRLLPDRDEEPASPPVRGDCLEHRARLRPGARPRRGAGPRNRHPVAFAAAMRLMALFAPPYLSSDIYRYVWDGRVLAAGINPYRYIPTDPQLDHLRDPAIWPEINRSNYAPTIYPPAAQAIFFAATR